MYKYGYYFLIMLYLALTSISPANANTKHTVGCRVFYSDGSIPSSVTFKAFVKSRPDEILYNTSPDCGYGVRADGNTYAYVQTANFPTQWQNEEILRFEVTGPNGSKGSSEYIFEVPGNDKAPDIILDKEKIDHTVFGRVFNHDGSMPISITFKAYVSSRPNEILTQSSAGCGYGDHSNYPQYDNEWYVQNGNFPTQWQDGDELIVEITGPNGSTGKATKILSLSGNSWADDVYLSKVDNQKHTVYCKVFNADGTIPPSVTFRAYVKARPNEVLYEYSPACGYGVQTDGNTYAFVQTANFPTQWQNGEILRFEVTGPNGSTGLSEYVFQVPGNDKAPDIVLSGSTNITRIIRLVGDMEFGELQINESSTRTLSIFNDGNSTLLITQIQTPDGFSGEWNGEIAPGEKQDVPITFTPTHTSPYSGTIIVSSNSTGGTDKITVNGTGVNDATRIIRLEGDMDFGEVQIRESVTRTLSIFNDGNSTLSITHLQTPDGFSGDWNGEIAPGGKQDVSISFTPKQVNSYSGTIIVGSNSTGGADKIMVSGDGVDNVTRIIRLEGDMDFGEVEIGESVTRTLSIFNDGNATLSIYNVKTPEGFSSKWEGDIPSGRKHDISVTFNPTSAQLYSGFISFSSNSTSGTEKISISGIGVQNTLDKITIGNIEITADKITKTSEQTYLLQDNVILNKYIYCDCDLQVNLNKLEISGDGNLYMSEIPNVGNILLLCSGSFHFNLIEETNTLINNSLKDFNRFLELACMPVRIEGFSFITGGIELSGKLLLPSDLGNFEADIESLQITKNNGIELIGFIEISDIEVKKVFTLHNLKIGFNTIENIFTGEAYLETKHFELAAGAEFIDGALNRVEIEIGLSKPIPIGSTGLALSGASGKIDGLQRGPLYLEIGASLVPTIQQHLDIVEFNNFTLGYSFGRELSGSGNLQLFDQSVAGVWMKISTSSAQFGGEVNFIDILKGRADIGISKQPDNQLLFEGNAYATIYIPEQDKFPLDYLGCIIDLPYAVAETENHLRNTHIWGETTIKFFQLSWDIEYKNDNITIDFDRKWRNMNNSIVANSKSLSGYEIMPGIQSNMFEGRSIIVQHFNNRLGKKNPYHSFELNTIESEIIIRIEGSQKSPSFYITDPNGNIFSPSTTNQFSNVEFAENKDAKKEFFYIKHPVPGNYKIYIDEEDTYYWDIFGTNISPSIEIGEILNDGKFLNINWNDSDPDDNASIELFIDNDLKGFNGELIASNINEDDVNNHYSWSHENYPKGEYYIYAKIQDNSNVPVFSYYTKSIKISDANAPNPPTNLRYSVNDSTSFFEWHYENTDSIKFILYYQESNKTGLTYNSKSISVGGEKYIEANFLTPGKSYEIAIAAQDNESRESELSDILKLDYISTLTNNSPQIINYPQNEKFNNSTNWTFQTKVVDADNDQIAYALSEAPEGMTIDEEGMMSWNAELMTTGMFFFSLMVNDNANAVDSVKCSLTVLDSLGYRSNILLNNSQYSQYGEQLTITLSDPHLNQQENKIESGSITIFTSNFPEKHNIKAYEIDTNSSKFKVTMTLDSLQTNFPYLKVNKNDTIFVSYLDAYPSEEIMTSVIFKYDEDSENTKVTNSAYAPQKYNVKAAYPNPFNSQTILEYSLAKKANVKIAVFNILGEHIVTIVSGEMDSGKHNVLWNGKNQGGIECPSGIYLFQIDIKNSENDRRIIKKSMYVK